MDSASDLARKQNPDCKVYSLSNDTPYVDWNFNYPGKKTKQFDKVDRILVRGDGSIELDKHIRLNPQAYRNVEYVGHYIDPLPQRTSMPESERNVVVT